MKKGQRVTYLKTGQTGTYLRKDRRKLSIELWIVKFHGDDFETTISPSLLKEGQYNYAN
jgi:hypothetical protein